MDNLQFLINNLSKGEKKKVSFFLKAGTSKESNQYKVYKVYTGQYNDLKQIDSIYASMKNLPATRNQLFETIVNVLSEDLQSFDAYYHREINSIYFITSKELYDVALKRTHRLFEKSFKHERGAFCLELFFLEVKLLRLLKQYNKIATIINKRVDKLKDVLKESEVMIDQFVYYNEIQINYHIHGASRSTEIENTYKDFIKNLKSLPQLNYLSNVTKNYNYLALITIYFAIGNFKEALKYTTKLVQIFEDNPHEKNSDVNQYSTVLYNHLALLIFHHKFKEFDDIILLYKDLKTNNIREKISINEKYFNLLFLKIIESKDFSGSNKIIKEFEAFYETYSTKVNLLFKALLIGQMVCIHMNLNDFKGALMWNNRFFEIKGYKTLRNDLLFAAELFEIIIHYELKNFELLFYKVNSFKGKLAKKKNRYKIEEILIKHISKLINQPNETNFTALYAISKEIDAVSKNKFEIDLLKKFDLVSYFKKKSKE